MKSNPFALRLALRWRLAAKRRTYSITAVVLLLTLAPTIVKAAGVAPAEVMEGLRAGKPQEVIVEYDARTIESEAASRRLASRIRFDNATLRAFKAARYKQLKATVVMGPTEAETITDYSHLPMKHKRLKTAQALQKLLNHPSVKGVYPNRVVRAKLAQSLPLISQPEAAQRGFRGANTSVAILDTGVNYRHPAFGSCTAPGVPTGCRVSAYVNFADRDARLDPDGHGTNVAAIALGVAPSTRILAVKVLAADGFGTDAGIIRGINWAIANRGVHNTAAINMSLGGGEPFFEPCATDNPYLTPVEQANANNIVVVAASGNEESVDALIRPACTPGVVSVGAVYDASGISGDCLFRAETSVVGRVTCWSNSADYLTLLAPGSQITAAGQTLEGTSQATPHVAGAAAALRSAFPNEGRDQLVQRLVLGGVPVRDVRNGFVTPRLDLYASVLRNDLFANRTTLSGPAGNVEIRNRMARKQPGEPNHAGVPGGRSVWWRWVGPSFGTVAINTHGSNVNTVLAVYTGPSETALTQIAANDNDGSARGASGVTFQVSAGVEYVIAVDTVGGAAGDIQLNWRHQPAIPSLPPLPPASACQGTPFHRLWSATAKDHFYTASPAEVESAFRVYGYVYEGFNGYIFASACAPGLVPVYRLVSAGGGDHFYTTSTASRDSAQIQFGYQYEGIAGYIFNYQAPGTTAFHQLYSAGAVDHFYTNSEGEAVSAQTVFHYKYEGIIGYIASTGVELQPPAPPPPPPPPPCLATPFYRMWDAGAKDHFYTASAAEGEIARNVYGYVYEGVAGYIYTSPCTAGLVPLYRLLNSTMGDHFYTIDPNQRGIAMSAYGYADEGIAGYMFNFPAPNTSPFHRLYSAGSKDHFYTASQAEANSAVASFGYVYEGVDGYINNGP